MLQGDLAQAYVLLQQSVHTIKTSIHPSVLGKIQPLLALTTLYHGESTEARRLLMECLDIWRTIGDKRYLALVSVYLAETALWDGNIRDAERWLAQALGYQVDPGKFGNALINYLYVVARLAAAQHEYQRAAILFGAGEQVRADVHCTLVAPMRAQIDAALAHVRANLEAAVFDKSYATGRQMSSAEVLSFLLSASVPTTLDNLEAVL